MTSRLLILFATVLATTPFVGPAAGQHVESRPTSQAAEASSPMPRIDVGTAALNPGPDRWNRLVLIATPQINSGDSDAVGETMSVAATTCSLTIMATVVRNEAPIDAQENSTPNYRLDEVGVGYSGPGTDGSVVIDSETASQLGVPLGFIARQVLRANEQRLVNVTVAGKSANAVVFDAPSVMQRNGQHRRYLTRHLVAIDPAKGTGTLSVWLLVPPGTPPNTDASVPHPIIDQPIRFCPWGIEETRRIHVDAEHFNLLGVPGELAFALEDLPPGKDVTWTRAAARLAGLRTFSAEQLDALVQAIEAARLEL